MNKNDFYTTTETGEKFGVTRVTILEWISDGKIKPEVVRKFGTRSKIKKSYVDKLAIDFESGKTTSIP